MEGRLRELRKGKGREGEGGRKWKGKELLLQAAVRVKFIVNPGSLQYLERVCRSDLEAQFEIQQVLALGRIYFLFLALFMGLLS